jgi:hypothetical protein
MTRRRNQQREGIESTLPSELRSFDSWYYPMGLQEYMAALSQFIGSSERVTPVMNAANLSAADWFRHMLTRGTEAHRSNFRSETTRPTWKDGTTQQPG